MWPQRTWNQNSGPLVTSPIMTLDVSFGQASLEWFFFPSPSMGRVSWPLAAFSLLSSGHFDNRPFFLLRQPRYVHFLPYSRFFPWSHWRPGTRRWPRPFQSCGTLAWPTTRWLFCFSACFLRGTVGRVGCILLWPAGQPYNSPLQICGLRNSQGGGLERVQAKAGVHPFSHRYLTPRARPYATY